MGDVPDTTSMAGKLETIGWLMERLENCERHAAARQGTDRAGWLEDAAYFRAAIKHLRNDNPIRAAPMAFLEDARHYAAVCPVPYELTGLARIEMLERRERILTATPIRASLPVSDDEMIIACADAILDDIITHHFQPENIPAAKRAIARAVLVKAGKYTYDKRASSCSPGCDGHAEKSGFESQTDHGD